MKGLGIPVWMVVSARAALRRDLRDDGHVVDSDECSKDRATGERAGLPARQTLRPPRVMSR